MAPKATLALLFHPKKGAKKDTTPNQTSPRKSSATPRPKPVPVIEEEEEELKLPDGPYQEFRLMSSALNGWKYDVMKFDSRKPVDISRWTAPIKLNRKEMRRDDGSVNSAPEAVGPMLGPDGKPVIGADGKFVMVDAEGRPIHNTDGSSANGKGKGAGMNAKKRFQKKTRQVYYVPEEVRQLRREERYPWVMEDSSQAQNEVWIGQMEDAAKSETHAFFMPAANDIFKFVPAHRWYKFQKKLKHDLPTDTANVESLVRMSLFLLYQIYTDGGLGSILSTKKEIHKHGLPVGMAKGRRLRRQLCSKQKRKAVRYLEVARLFTVLGKV